LQIQRWESVSRTELYCGCAEGETSDIAWQFSRYTHRSLDANREIKRCDWRHSTTATSTE